MKVIPLIGADMQSIFFDWNRRISSYAPKGIKGLCLLIDLGDGLKLIDTGFSAEYAKNPKELKWFYRIAMAKGIREEQSIYHQLRLLNYDPQKVNEIILTHLHVDHSGGLRDFPNAKVTVYRKEYEAATRRASWNEKITYNPDNWLHHPNWNFVELGESFNGFQSKTILNEGGGLIKLIGLPGHCKGHCGVYIECGDYRLFHCADAFLSKRSLVDPSFEFPPHFRWFRNFIIHSDKERKETIVKLQSLLNEQILDKSEFTCSHDEADIIKQMRRAKAFFS